MGLMGVGAFALGVMTLCAWRRLTGRDPFDIFASFGPRRRQRSISPEELWDREERGGGRPPIVDGCNDVGKKPVIFNAWTDRKTNDEMKWEEFGNQRMSGPVPGGDGEDKRGKEQHRRVSSLQVAVLLAMPSPAREKVHQDDIDEEPPRGHFGEELAIGLIGVPWFKEDDHKIVS
ncbi:hypothetical protein BGW80DRAFT_1292025 [Lactifluus volemus]|nr:hypothetical protein BGW80DRAFT_1292025 [Lactifluus volemus]